MIKSMTAFAKQTKTTSYGEIIWEIKSLNHKYLDLSFNLHDSINEDEPKFRKLCLEFFKRGKIELNLKYIPNETKKNNFIFNRYLFKKIIKTIELIKSNFKIDSDITISDVIRFPGISKVIVPYNSLSICKQDIFLLFGVTIKKLQKERIREGGKISKKIRLKILKIQNNLKKIIKKTDLEKNKLKKDFFILQKNIVTDKKNDLQAPSQGTYIYKSDISEEIERLQIHSDEILVVLTKKNDPVGKKIDFFMQEIMREANTISSKSQNIVIIKSAVEIKLLSEQIREQSHNIE